MFWSLRGGGCMWSKRVLSPLCTPYPFPPFRRHLPAGVCLITHVSPISPVGHFPEVCVQWHTRVLSPLCIPPILCPLSNPLHVCCSCHAIVTLGTRVMFHSALVFISLSGSTFSICTASVICRSIASFRNVPVTLILNCCVLLLWMSLQCRHNGEFLMSRRCRSSCCFLPLVYPLSADSPL